MHERTRAHGARFNCSKQFAVSQAMVTHGGTSCAQDNDFGVGGGVGVGEVAVPAAGDDFAITNDDGAHGHFTGFERTLGGAESFFHPQFVGGQPVVGRSSLVVRRHGVIIVTGSSTGPAFCDRAGSGILNYDMGMPSLLRKIFMVDLLQGLKVTFRYQDPREIYTEQYPLQRPQVAERYRGAPRLNVNPDTNETMCIACDLCALACPENLIVVSSERNEKTRRKELTNFTYDLSRCMFCGLCEDACPTDALELTQDFELASYTREGAIWNREMLEKGPQPTQYRR
jgi:NADH-quinone oxidoreductase subunit I